MIISGLIVPKLILETFGSEVNGLVSSLTQFLNYISLVEGGLGSVVLAALYYPLAKKDNEKLSSVMSAANKFFQQIAYIFVCYILVLGFIYPLVIKSDFSNFYIFFLTIILGIGLFVQYFFSITFKLLLQADQKLYIVQLVQIGTTIINLILVYMLISIFPKIHVVKLFSSLVFVIQPFIYYKYVNKHYYIQKNIEPDKNILVQRWNCFGQNFAFFIHNNTDIVVLSLFCDLKIVSVYSIYFLVVNSIKNFLLSVSNAFTPIIGKFMAQKDFNKANKYFNLYEFIMDNVATIVFGSCIYLLPSFVLLYTKGINDVDYWKPIFSIIIILAELLYCFRDPYVSLIYSVGKFKATAKSSYIEAIINIVLSIGLVFKFGLIGIAIGTLAGMGYRMIYSVWFVNTNIIYRPYSKFLKRMVISIIIIVISTFIINMIDITGSESILLWVKNGFLCIVVYGVITILINSLLDFKTMESILKLLKR